LPPYYPAEILEGSENARILLERADWFPGRTDNCHTALYDELDQAASSHSELSAYGRRDRHPPSAAYFHRGTHGNSLFKGKATTERELLARLDA
jgi:hypothetical protein